MSRVVVGKWGKSLAIRVPLDVARVAGLTEGEIVDVDTIDGNVVIRRSDAREAAQRDAEAAAEAILARGKGMSLGGVSIRQLLEEGRRG